MPIARRDALRLGALSLATTLLRPKAGNAASAFAGRSITYASWGGEFQDAQKLAYCDPFAKKYSATVIQDGPVSNTRIRVALEARSADWDVICSDDYMLQSLDKLAYLAVVDESLVDTARIYPEYRFDHGPACGVGAVVLAYSTVAFNGKKHPKVWEDFFNVREFPGKRMLSNSVIRNLEIGLLADGVAPSRLYPLDVDRAFKKLDTIKDSTIFFESFAQSQQLIVDGVVTCGPMYANRAFGVIRKGAKIGVSWEGNLRNATLHIVPKSSANVDMAWALVSETLDAANQAHFAELQTGSPTNPAALSLISDDLRPWMATTKENMSRGIDVDAAYWGKNLPTLTQRWQAWLLQ